VLVVLLCVTVIGIPAVPFSCSDCFAPACLARQSAGLAGLARHGPTERGADSHPVVAVLIGGALVLAMYCVPMLGFLVYKLLGLLGLGAVVYT